MVQTLLRNLLPMTTAPVRWLCRSLETDLRPGCQRDYGNSTLVQDKVYCRVKTLLSLSGLRFLRSGSLALISLPSAIATYYISSVKSVFFSIFL